MNQYNWQGEFQKRLNARQEKDLLRTLPNFEGKEGMYVLKSGRRVLNLNSNDYLNLATHSDVKKVALFEIEKEGVGAGSARLLGGGIRVHLEFEKKMSDSHGTEKALIFNSGYMANFGVLGALSSQCAEIFSDKLNHASIVDGIVLSKKRFSRFQHTDMNHLESLLKKSKAPDRSIVVSETLFSMDGDFAPLEDMFALQKKFGFFLYLDEAHSLGGYPITQDTIKRNMNDKTLVMGTLGKALGSFGAFVCGAAATIDFLVNYSRSFIFATAIPGHLIAAALKAQEIIESDAQRLKNLYDLSEWLRRELQSKEIDVLNSSSHIIPLMVGSAVKAKAMALHFEALGYHCLPIRPPTVPEGMCRLRLSLCCEMKKENFSKLMSEGALWEKI